MLVFGFYLNVVAFFIGVGDLLEGDVVYIALFEVRFLRSLVDYLSEIKLQLGSQRILPRSDFSKVLFKFLSDIHRLRFLYLIFLHDVHWSQFLICVDSICSLDGLKVAIFVCQVDANRLSRLFVFGRDDE